MTPPSGLSFSWVEQPLLSASGFPFDEEDLQFLRQSNVEILLTLTEDPVARRFVDAAGLMSVHVPIGDMRAPAQDQIDQCLAVIEKVPADPLECCDEPETVEISTSDRAVVAKCEQAFSVR